MNQLDDIFKKAMDGEFWQLEEFVRRIIEDKEDAVKALRRLEDKLEELSMSARGIADDLEEK